MAPLSILNQNNFTFKFFMDMDSDLYFMKEALKEANKAAIADEVPVGAVLVYRNKIISRGHNQVETLKDATAHAEILCITSAAAHFHEWRLTDAVLYCTLEPCCMCAGAIINSRIKRVVFGAADIRVGASGSLVDVFACHPIHKVEIVRGVLEEESKELLKKFFSKKRKSDLI